MRHERKRWQADGYLGPVIPMAESQTAMRFLLRMIKRAEVTLKT